LLGKDIIFCLSGLGRVMSRGVRCPNCGQELKTQLYKPGARLIRCDNCGYTIPLKETETVREYKPEPTRPATLSRLSIIIITILLIALSALAANTVIQQPSTQITTTKVLTVTVTQPVTITTTREWTTTQVRLITTTTSQSEVIVAPDFTLPTITAEGLTNISFTLSGLRGKPVFLDFIFEWCQHCSDMAPTVKRLYREYGDRVAFVTVMGSYNTTPVKSARFLIWHDIRWTTVYDVNMKVFNEYAVRGTPTYFIIASDGSILMRLVGETSYDILRQALEKVG